MRKRGPDPRTARADRVLEFATDPIPFGRMEQSRGNAPDVPELATVEERCRSIIKDTGEVEKRGRSVGTARRELGVLRAAINYAFKNGRITRPVAVELPDSPEPRDRWLSRIEVARLIRRPDCPGPALHATFRPDRLYTGRRKEAILSLRWPQSDLERSHDQLPKLPVAGELTSVAEIVPIPGVASPHLKRATTRKRYGLCTARRWRADRRHQERLCRGLQTIRPGRRHAAHPAPLMCDLVNATWHRSMGGLRFPVDEHGNLAACLRPPSPRLSARSRGEYQPTSGECPRNCMMFAMRSAFFGGKDRENQSLTK